jgi:hypothetical protein
MVLTTMGSAPSSLPASRISTRIHQDRTSDADAHLFHHWWNKKIGFTAIYSSAKSYIAFKEAWTYLLIPSKKGGAADQPSDFHAKAKKRAGPLDIEPLRSCESGHNAVFYRLPRTSSVPGPPRRLNCLWGIIKSMIP